MGISHYHVAEIMTTTRNQCICECLCLNLQCHSSGNLLTIGSQFCFFFPPDIDVKIRRPLMNSTLQYFSTKKLGSYADICIYSSTFVSLKMLIYSEIYIKPLKTFLFTFFKKMKSIVSFATTCQN